MLLELVKKGKSALVGIGMLALSCTTYAKRDYDMYPAHRKEIALYNIDQILIDNCGWDQVRSAEEYVACVKGCKRYASSYTDRLTGITITPNNCTEQNDQEFYVYWEIIRNIEVWENRLYFTGSSQYDFDIHLKDHRQAAELKEAIEVYLGRR